MGRENLEEWDVLVGRINGTWDRALLRVRPFTENLAYFHPGGELVVRLVESRSPGASSPEPRSAEPRSAEPRKLEIKRSARKNHDVVIDAGLVTPQDAAPFVGQEVFVHPEMRPDLGEGEFYIDQILGYRVFTEEGDDLGEIEEVLETAAHDVYVTPHAMIPAVPEFVIERDEEKQTITVRDMPGLRTDER